MSPTSKSTENLSSEKFASSLNEDEVTSIQTLQDSYSVIKDELSRIIIGQEEAIEKIFICMLSQGHALLMGVPGLAKTLLVNSIAKITSLTFSRIQFTPDLMPSDVTGTEILQNRKDGEGREFKFIKGPVFANVLLADEINRTPPKTQSALLEAMQEKHVTVAGKNHLLQKPFFVLATQNPIEQEGTYPLPEAQLDRFMFCGTNRVSKKRGRNCNCPSNNHGGTTLIDKNTHRQEAQGISTNRRKNSCPGACL